MRRLLIAFIVIALIITILFSVLFFNIVLNKRFLNIRPYPGLSRDEYGFVHIVNDDLRLQGYLRENPTSDSYVLLIHGYTGNGATMLEYADYYSENGYNILIIDHRIHGNSEGEYCTMGIKESDDILNWIDFIVERNPDSRIVLHGISMGAAALMMATGDDGIEDNVVAAIEDCGFTSALDEFAYQMKERIGIEARLLLKASSLYARMKAGFFYGENSPIESIKDSQVPTLFIHGSKDNFVPFCMVEELYNSAGCEKELLVVEGAGHVMSHIIEPEKYWSAVDSFLEKQGF